MGFRNRVCCSSEHTRWAAWLLLERRDRRDSSKLCGYKNTGLVGLTIEFPEREQEKLEKTKYVRFDAPVTMKVLPTLISNTNLIAILHSRNDHLRERVADALTAGPPQAPRKP